jgi:hypothetical protein
MLFTSSGNSEMILHLFIQKFTIETILHLELVFLPWRKLALVELLACGAVGCHVLL